MNKIKLIYDFFRLWVKWGDWKEAWEDAKFINDKEIQKELEEETMRITNWLDKHDNPKLEQEVSDYLETSANMSVMEIQSIPVYDDNGRLIAYDMKVKPVMTPRHIEITTTITTRDTSWDDPQLSDGDFPS